MNKIRSAIDILFIIFIIIYLSSICLVIICFKEAGINVFENKVSYSDIDNHIVAGTLLNDTGKYCIIYDDGRIEVKIPK